MALLHASSSIEEPTHHACVFARRLCTKPGAALAPYTDKEDFLAALNDFEVTYSITHKDPNESDEAAIMRLAARLKDNAPMLQVSINNCCLCLLNTQPTATHCQAALHAGCSHPAQCGPGGGRHRATRRRHCEGHRRPQRSAAQPPVWLQRSGQRAEAARPPVPQ